jgi:timeless
MSAAGAASKTVAQKSPKKNVAAQSKPKKAAAVTPALHEASLAKRMSVDKNIVDELLLVSGVIGTTVDDTDELVPVTDCLNWLQDLQRALRRDDDLYRPVSLLLGQWKIVQQKLLPLVLHSRYDTAMVLTVCKILVILTKPLAENTVRAGRMVIDTKSKKATDRYALSRKQEEVYLLIE